MEIFEICYYKKIIHFLYSQKLNLLLRGNKVEKLNTFYNNLHVDLNIPEFSFEHITDVEKLKI